MKRWLAWIAGGLVALLVIVGAALLLVDTSIGHRFVADRIGDIRTDNGLRFSVGRIEGSIYRRATLIDVRVYDMKGLVFEAPRADLDWRPFAWARNRLDIRSLLIPQASVLKPLETRRTGRHGPILPGFDIAIGRLHVGRLDLAPRVTGVARTGSIDARADIHDRRALIDLAALVQGSDRVRARIDAAPDDDRFDIAVSARGAADGVLARMSGIRQPLAVEIGGDGSWQHWQGTARVDAGGQRIVALSLGNRAGAYTLGGTLMPSAITHGKVQRLTAPLVRVEGAATFVDRRLDGRLSLRSPSLAAETTGTLDLAASAFRDVRITARLLRPPALFPNMTGHDIALRATLDGPFATARFAYRLTAQRVAFDDTGFEDAHAVGQGHLGAHPFALPVHLVAARVTGVGEVAGGILHDLSIAGVLRIGNGQVIGRGLAFRSDKLAGSIDLKLRLSDGVYRVGLTGTLGRYLIPGLGLVDVRSQLNVVPGPGGHGTRVVGQGTATMLRLDNAFFRSLTGGLPRIVTGLERTSDGILHLTHLVLTSPSLRLTGTGYRRRDGTFHFEGGGRQATYGPVTLVLDGKIDHPTLDLVFARPNAALGLHDVRAHLDPDGNDFLFRAVGASRLGPFETEGRIALPSGGQATIQVARLDVTRTRATGALAIVDGGFLGRLAIAGGGLGGDLLFRPVGTIQQIAVHLEASDARLANAATVRRGRLDATVLLDPAGTIVDATASGAGLTRGALKLARFAGHAHLKDGVGEVRASIAGSRGRVFDLQTIAQIGTHSYTIDAQGTLDRRPLKLLSPAVITAEDDGYRLATTRLAFAGGEAEVSGRFGSTATEVDAALTRMPLSILDIGYPGLGLGGSASGHFGFADIAGAAPTGRMDLTIRGLTRSGLVLSSRPIDVGLAGVLSADRAGVRAVMASGGKTVGRAQAMLAPLAGGGDLATRLANAPLIAQLRYDGPADTLWRLTGVEIFDLSGPVAIAADVGGRLAGPTIRGVLRTSGAKIDSAITGTVLTNVEASGRFGGSRLVLDRFGADAGKGGHVTGTANFDFAAAHGLGIDIRLNADHAVMIARDDIGATVSGPLTIRSDGQGGVIGGDVILHKSRYRLGQATAATAVPQLNIREVNLPFDAVGDDTPRQPWTLALHAHASNGLSVSGLGLTSEWSADLQIAGEPENPAITGRAKLVRGNYEFSGREFELDRGVIRFAGNVPANPALDIAADANTNGINATIRVTGFADKPEIGFTSVPALPQDELLSRLLFGTSITNLSAPEALQLAAAVAALQNGGTGLNPINAVRRAAGLDRLRIVPADPQTGQGTAIAAGKYITRRFYAEIVTDGQGYSATQVEFQVTRWLSLLSSISTLGRTSANVRVSKDY